MNDESGKTLRDLGMKQAADHSDKVEPDWSIRATNKLKRFLVYWKFPDFTCEEFQQWAYSKGLSHPASPEAWGTLIMNAARSNIICKTGNYRAAKTPVKHARALAVWRKYND